MTIVVWLALFSGCGRVHFDPSTADASSTQDALPTTCSTTAPFMTVSPLTTLNSSGVYGDGGLRLSDDELAAYFHSNRSGAARHDIYSATRTSITDSFAPPVVVYTEPPAESFFPFPTPDQMGLVFDDAQDLFIATRTDLASAFSNKTPLAASSTNMESAAYPVGSRLYFSRYNPEGAIYVASWPDGVVSGSLLIIETVARERSSVLSSDELTIYFARLQGGMGDEIMVAHRDRVTDDFSPPTFVDELNTANDDTPTWLSPDRCRLYFESSRTGDFELYVAERTP